MAHYPQSAVGLSYATYPAGPTAPGTTLTGSGTANTKGSYVEFEDSTTFASNYIEIHLGNGASNRQQAVDLATGAGGAETVVVPNMLSDTNGTSSHVSSCAFRLPLAIAISTRVSMRVAVNSTSSDTIRAAITLIASGDTEGPTSYVNYGYDSSDSGGVSVDPGAMANTKGAYSELTSSTSAITQIICVNVTYKANTAGTSAFFAVDIATGAGGAEVVLIPDLRFQQGWTASQATGIKDRTRTFLTYIPASTRIAAAASSDLTDATDRLIDVAVLAATAPAESGGGGGSVIAVRRTYQHFRL